MPCHGLLRLTLGWSLMGAALLASLSPATAQAAWPGRNPSEAKQAHVPQVQAKKEVALHGPEESGGLGPMIFPAVKPPRQAKNFPQINYSAKLTPSEPPAEQEQESAWPGRSGRPPTTILPRQGFAWPGRRNPSPGWGIDPQVLQKPRPGHPVAATPGQGEPRWQEQLSAGGKNSVVRLPQTKKPAAAHPQKRAPDTRGEAGPPSFHLQRLLQPLVEQAVVLADRRAFYAARQRLLRSMELLAQPQDQPYRGTEHQQALRRALLTLEEAQDFVPEPGRVQSELDVVALAAGHETPVASQVTPTTTAQQALSLYYTYAQEQLVAALGRTGQASQVLSTLGKLYAYMAGEPRPLLRDCLGQALVFQQAALLADRNNPAAANELGVLLARLGRYEEALGWLSHSVRLRPESRAWHNLSVVYARLGRPDLAQQAQRWAQVIYQRQLAGQRITRRGALEVRWVAPEQFRGKQKEGAATSTQKARVPSHRRNIRTR